MPPQKLDITCSNGACEHDFEFETEFDPGDPGGWSAWDGGWPPIPAAYYPVDDPVLCPKCGHDCTKRAQQICDDYEEPEQEPPEYDFEDDR